MILALLLACTADKSPAARTAETGHPAETGQPTDSADTADTSAPTTFRSALYPPDWTPATTHESGAFLHDFSYAGYGGGDRDLPPTPTPTLWVTGADPTGVEDSGPAFRAAIAAAVAPAVIGLPPGLYRIDGTLQLTQSEVALVGAGSEQTQLYFTTTEGMSDQAHLSFVGAISPTAETPLQTDALARSPTVTVDDPSPFAVGDAVELGFVITPEFVEDHGMTGTWTEFLDQWKTFYRRTITAIDGHTLTLDVPLRAPLLTRDSASVRKVEGALHDCAIEGIGLSTVNDWDTAWTLNRTHALRFEDVTDCYARDIASFEGPLSTDGRGRHLLSGGIVIRDSRRVTLQAVSMAAPQNRGGGGNGYLIEISRSNEILVEDSSAIDGRHNFIQNWDFGSSGLVWRRVHSAGGEIWADKDTGGTRGCSEFHHSLATANLIEQSTIDDCWKAVNRGLESSGAGHTATETTFYNNDGLGYIWSLQWALGHVIGAGSLSVQTALDCCWIEGLGTEPEDWTEADPRPLDPPSLYDDQRARRHAATEMP